MELLACFAAAFMPANLLAMAAGVAIGLVIGALPGLTANLGVALLLPATFSMDATAAILLLMSVYTAAIYGGSFTAILLHTPGTSASAPTAIEGFALTERGEAGRAIRVATVASVVGGVASGVALLAFAPPLSLLALQFGPAEYLMLAVFGLTAVATLSTGNMIKGLMAGAAGVLLSTVGLDSDSGFPRFTFGLFALQAGVSFVPAAIGLFSLSQALLMCERPNHTVRPAGTPAGRWHALPTRDEMREIGPALARSSLLGIVVGILPGAGADIGAWVSYQDARRRAEGRTPFGEGSIVGIAAAEAGNNAVTGSSLIPLLTLGIPGSPTAAILLGALVMHDLQPGRALFTEHAAVIYTMVFGFLLANVVMGIAGTALGRFLIHVAGLPNAALIPAIVLLSIVGSYSLGSDMGDVYTMMAFGLLGYGMRKTGFHPASLILGLILGPIAETGLRQSLTLADGRLAAFILRSPICLVLAGLTVASVATTLYRARPLLDGPPS